MIPVQVKFSKIPFVSLAVELAASCRQMARAAWIKMNVWISPVKMADIASMKILALAIVANVLMVSGVKTANLSRRDRPSN